MKLAEHDIIGRQAIVSALSKATRKDARAVRKEAFEAAQSAISSLEHASRAVDSAAQLFQQLAHLQPYTRGILVSRKRKRKEAESDGESGLYDSDDDFEGEADFNLSIIYQRLSGLSAGLGNMVGNLKRASNSSVP